jgi:type IV pilus assembly protein PilO
MALLPEAKRDQLMLGICIVALALVYVYYDYVYTPKGDTLTQLEERIDKLVEANNIIDREVKSGRAEKLKAEADSLGRMLSLMRLLVPESNEVPALLNQISNAARQASLEISTTQPLGVTPGEVFDTHKYRLIVTGPYHKIGLFLDNVGSLTRIMAPMNLTLRPSGKGKGPRASEQLLDANFEVHTYVLRAGASRVVAPPAAGGQ